MSELRLLLSAQAQERIAGDLESAFGDVPWRAITFEEAVTDPAADADIGFISRDVTGRSTKHEVSETLAACYSVLRRAPSLKWVQTHSAGLDRPIFGELRARGITVTSSSGANAMNVAHSAVGGVIALARRFPLLFAAQREHRWTALLGNDLPRDLAGQIAVIVGWGPIGKTIARLLMTLGLTVRVVRRSTEPAGDGIGTFDFTQFHDALDGADWLLLACPLTETTQGIVTSAALDKLSPGAFFVNVARGECVDTPALVAALQSKRLGGAFLDVFEHEPLEAASPFWDLPMVIVSPHSSGHSSGNAPRVERMFVDNLRRWVSERRADQVASKS